MDDKYARICIVGNGPSATDMGHVIDEWPFVVRCNNWQMKSATNSGTKIDARASNGWDGIHEAPEGAVFEYWFNKPIGTVGSQMRKRYDRICTIAGDNVVQVMPLGRYLALRDCLESGVTCGFCAIDMAITFGVKELLLVGFDATTPRQQGWHDANYKAPLKTVEKGERTHNHIGEKHQIDTLVKHGLWLGRFVATKTTWILSPKMETVVRKVLAATTMKGAPRA